MENRSATIGHDPDAMILFRELLPELEQAATSIGTEERNFKTRASGECCVTTETVGCESAVPLMETNTNS